MVTEAPVQTVTGQPSLRTEVNTLLRAHGVAIAVFTVLATVFLADVLFMDKSLSAFDTLFYDEVWRSEYTIPDVYQHDLQDSPTAHYPQRRFDWESLKNGHNPSLNPYLFSGMSWMSEGPGAFVTSWPQLLFDTADAMDWTAWIHLVLAGLFMYFCAMQFGAGRIAAIFAGVVWTYNLHQVAWLEYPQHPGTQLWIPLLFGLNMLLLKSGFKTSVVVALIVANTLFATSGYTQIVLFTFLLIGLFNTLYAICVMEGSPGQRAANWARLHAIYIVAALLYSMSMFVQVDVIQEGLRGSQDWRGNLETAEVSVASFLEFLFRLIPIVEEIKRLYSPDYYGGVLTGEFVNEFSNTIEYIAYPGILSLLFGFYYISKAGARENRRLGLVLLLCLGTTWATMYGIPFMVWVLQHIPFAGMGNYSRLVTLVVFLIALISSLGLQQFLQDAPGDRWRRLPLVLLVMFAIPALVHLLGEALVLDKLFYGLGICVLFAFLAWGAERFGGWSVAPAVIALVFITADLFYVGRGFNTRLPNQLIFPQNSTIRYVTQDPDIFRVAVSSEGAGYQPNMLSYYQVPVVSGYSTVMSNRYRTFVNQAMPGVVITLNGIMTLPDPDPDVLRIMNVKYLISIRELDDPLLEEVFFANNNYLYRIRDWVPRAYCADRVQKYEESKFIPYDLDRWASESRFPAAIDISVPFPGGVQQPDCKISDMFAYTNGLAVNVTAARDALLVLGYADDPNWRVMVNGDPAELVAVNGMFLGVVLPQGTHSVRLLHRNGLFTIYAAISIVLALLLIAYAIRRPARSQRILLITIGVLVIGKSAFLIPGIGNDEHPERMVQEASEPVRVPGQSITNYAGAGIPLPPGQEQRISIPAETSQLTRVRLCAATYTHPTLDGFLNIKILSPDGEALREVVVSGEHVKDLSWFPIDFEPIEKSFPEFFVSVSADYVPATPFSLWVDEEGRTLFETFYAFNKTSY